MKKRVLFIAISAVVTGIVFMGCQKDTETERRQKKVTKIVWQSEQDLHVREEYFNEVLKEKKLPYELEFVSKDTVKQGQIVDLLDTGWHLYEKSYDLTQDILDGKLIPLDEYLNTEEGRAIKDAFPENLWETYQVDGKQYTILSAGYVPKKTVYIWDKELAEKYDVHPEEWNERIWEYEEELLKVHQGENGAANFATISGLKQYSTNPIHMTSVLGGAYPIVINETDEDTKAEFLFETPEYQESLQGLKSLYEKGIYRPEIEENPDRATRIFLKIDSAFTSEGAYLSWQPEDFWKTHEIKVVGKEDLCYVSCSARQTGITVDSKQPKEVFQFMCELYKDVDLTNALIWGEEGVNYTLYNKRAVHPKDKGYVPRMYVANDIMAYPEVGQDVNKKEVYPKILKETKDSKIKGFNFSGKMCEEELNAIWPLYRNVIISSYPVGEEDVTGKEMLYENEAIIKQYKDAGIDKVIDEWNRQFQEWKAEQ